MSKQSKHERIIREELEAARSELRQAEEALRTHQGAVNTIEARIHVLEIVIARADADKGADDA